jgi:hypothetical protein
MGCNDILKISGTLKKKKNWAADENEYNKMNVKESR